MGIAQYIREIGRGKEGARSLDEEQAHDLMSQLLDGRLSDLEVGAFALAMRIKGESISELAGFLRATHERCLPLVALRSQARAVAILPSYNGARRLPNLTPLLAQLLAQEGVQVLVHGQAEDPQQRVTTAEVFQGLGLPVARHPDDIANAWARQQPVFMPTETLCPPLQRLLDVRRVVGLRNSAHTIAKLLDPLGGMPTLRVVNYTHPEYHEVLGQFLRHVRASAMLLRGTEGEPAADPRRLPRLEVYLQGDLHPELSSAPHEGVLAELPVLPRTHDAPTTAVYIQSVVSGEKPAPTPLLVQVEGIRSALALMPVATSRERIA